MGGFTTWGIILLVIGLILYGIGLWLYYAVINLDLARTLIAIGTLLILGAIVLVSLSHTYE